ncbi:MAG: DUF4260 domain-containing protein [Rhodopseudomonas sp.]|uniref:DUF4260 domain-containing protein n=1 Tax=Rhodopseudomonas sp. TaxID=1078 RepID=UPI0017A73232|nr:DUF4260 domain-containing protein [Rhodopseudomonas sp.]NVN86739.1 DUF4260 domain-containing protein [Rhodopseudomonas sp.]
MIANPTIPTSAGAVSGGVRTLMRLEGAALFFGPSLFYLISDAPWELYALLFFAPDLGLLGYLIGPRTGAITYNALHSTIGPLLLAAAGVILLWPSAGPIALIWLAHIGFDRVFGFGLKYAAGFKLTHLGRLGRDMGNSHSD